MQVALLLIGNEVLDGRIDELNATWLGRELKKHGLELREVLTCKDDFQCLNIAFSYLLENHEFIITSGGLGPTKDDKTKYFLANFFQKEIAHCSYAQKIVEENYDRFQFPYKKDQNHYAQVPKDFEILTNPKGLAPGLIYKNDKNTIMCAPGVPREFQAMVNEIFIPRILSNCNNDFLSEQIVFRTQNIPEEKIFFELCPMLWSELEQYGTISSLPRYSGVDVWITLKSPNIDELIEKKNKVRQIVYNSALKEYIWHEGEESIAEVIIKKCVDKGLTLSIAESCTGGEIANEITNVAGASKVFLGSVVSYHNDAKVKILGVQPQSIIDHGAVSEQVALQMAIKVREEFGSHLSVSTTGIAGPSGGSEEKPVGTVAIGISSEKSNKSFLLNFKGDRKRLKRKFATAAMQLLIEEIDSL